MTAASGSQHRKRNERGFAMVLIAISMVAIAAVAGFAVDLGAWYLKASKLQRASDAASLAGAAALPDTDKAIAEAKNVFAKNGLYDGVDGVSLTVEATPLFFTATAKDATVDRYFTKSFLGNFSMERSSRSAPPARSPQLGSPFNVLGTGDLNVPGIEQQGFWLAINNVCSPKEDGDFFSAKFDANKGPFKTNKDSENNFVPASNARHRCPGGVPNPDYSPAGYSYYIDVPPSPTSNGTVKVKIYDATYNDDPAPDGYPDFTVTLPSDSDWPNAPIAYDLFDTMGTPDNESDDQSLLPHPFAVWHFDTTGGTMGKWWELTTIPHNRIASGGQFRLQVIPFPDLQNGETRGMNSFAIGAFPSWKPANSGCDSRNDTTCPRVYGQHAVSIFNNLKGSAGSKNSFYFAEIGPEYTESTFDLMLWDPGEGVQKIEVLAPDGTPLAFDWTATPTAAGYAGVGTTHIDTGGTGPLAQPNLSNDFKFNDRLLKLRLTLPSNYSQMVNNAGGDKWLRIRYTIGTASRDRTTWGLALSGASSGSSRLVRLDD